MGFDWSKYANDDERFVRWSEGKVIEGEIVGIDEHDFNDGRGPHPQLTIATENGERVVTATQVELRRKLALLDVQIGDHISIEATGKTELSGGRGMWEFDLDVSGPTDRPRGHASPKLPPPASPAPADFADEPF